MGGSGSGRKRLTIHLREKNDARTEERSMHQRRRGPTSKLDKNIARSLNKLAREAQRAATHDDKRLYIEAWSAEAAKGGR